MTWLAGEYPLGSPNMDVAKMRIRRLLPEDAAVLAELRRAALEDEPLAFAASPSDDSHGTAESFRRGLATRDETAVMGAFAEGGDLVGMVGVGRVAKVKRRHKAVVWGMYVAPRARRQGLGRRLMEEAIHCAREWAGVEELALSVTTAAPEARRLYESLGFRPWGREPRGIRWNGHDVDEEHFVLELAR
jgi:GNAT superfamily N-acetyltransferase